MPGPLTILDPRANEAENVFNLQMDVDRNCWHSSVATISMRDASLTYREIFTEQSSLDHS